MNYGDFRNVGGLLDILLGEFALLVKGKLHEARFANFSQKQNNRGTGTEADSHIEGKEKATEESYEEDSGVGFS